MQKEERIEEGFIIITSDDAAERASYDWADMGRAVCKFGEDLKCCRKTRDRPEQKRRRGEGRNIMLIRLTGRVTAQHYPEIAELFWNSSHSTVSHKRRVSKVNSSERASKRAG